MITLTKQEVRWIIDLLYKEELRQRLSAENSTRAEKEIFQLRADNINALYIKLETVFDTNAKRIEIQ